MGKIKIPKTEYEKIVDMYKHGVSSVEIAKEYDCSYKTILRILEKCNIDRDWNSLRIYTLNEEYFDVVDTPNKAYILGLLYADGYNNTKQNIIRLKLQDVDKHILENIKNELMFNQPLEFIARHNENNNLKDIYGITIHSAHMSMVLDNLGMHQAKSLILTFPDWIDELLIPHFLRGYIDGDGSIYCYTKKMNWNISIVGTKKFCDYIQEIIQNILDVHSYIKLEKRRNDVTCDLRVGGNQQVLKFLNWIYKDADLKMDRKYAKYQQLVQYLNMNNSLIV